MKITKMLQVECFSALLLGTAPTFLVFATGGYETLLAHVKGSMPAGFSLWYVLGLSALSLLLLMSRWTHATPAFRTSLWQVQSGLQAVYQALAGLTFAVFIIWLWADRSIGDGKIVVVLLLGILSLAVSTTLHIVTSALQEKAPR